MGPQGKSLVSKGSAMKEIKKGFILLVCPDKAEVKTIEAAAEKPWVAEATSDPNPESRTVDIKYLVSSYAEKQDPGKKDKPRKKGKDKPKPEIDGKVHILHEICNMFTDRKKCLFGIKKPIYF